MLKKNGGKGSRGGGFRALVALVVPLALLVGSGVGCGGAKATAPDVVASSDLGEVTQVELDDFILSLPDDQRRPGAGQDVAAWRREKLEQLLVNRYLEREARDGTLIDTDEARALFEAQVDNLLQQEVEARRLRERVSVTNEDLQAYYDAHPEEFSRGEQVRLRHIFLRVDRSAPDAERQTVRARMERLLAELRDGANFEELAKANSDSETANLGGLIGRVNRGRLSRPVEDMIWALDAGEISEIVATPVGFHVYRVDDRLAAASRELAEVRGLLTRRLTRIQTDFALNEFFDELLTASEALYNPAGLASTDEATVLFELPEDSLTLGEWRQRFTNQAFYNQRATSEREQFETWARRRLYLWEATRSGLAEEPAIAEQIESMRAGLSVALAYRAERHAVIEAFSEDQRRAFYDANQQRFRTPRLFHLRLLTLTVPADDEGRGLFSRFERLDGIADRIRAGKLAFADAARQWSDDSSASAGGDVGAIRLDSFAEWAGPVAQKVVARLDVGQISDPLLIERYDERNLTYDRTGYMLVRVEEIREPEIVPFEDAHERVIQQLAERQSAEIGDTVAAEALDAIHARVYAENL